MIAIMEGQRKLKPTFVPVYACSIRTETTEEARAMEYDNFGGYIDIVTYTRFVL